MVQLSLMTLIFQFAPHHLLSWTLLTLSFQQTCSASKCPWQCLSPQKRLRQLTRQPPLLQSRLWLSRACTKAGQTISWLPRVNSLWSLLNLVHLLWQWLAPLPWPCSQPRFESSRKRPTWFTVTTKVALSILWFLYTDQNTHWQKFTLTN